MYLWSGHTGGYVVIQVKHWRNINLKLSVRAAFRFELQFLVCLRLLILNLLRLQDAWMAYDRRTETKEERKRRRTTKWYTSNSLKLVEVAPQVLFFDTKPFLISTDEVFLKSGLVVFSFVQE